MKFDFIGPGMTGSHVAEVQKIVGAPMTGEYDEETRQRVRGLQVLHKTSMQDGCWDDELALALGQTPGMSS